MARMDLLDDPAVLDVGIRDLVAFLWRHGWTTTDSGDGVSKVGTMECALQFPHVVVVTHPYALVDEAQALVRHAREFGLKVGPQGAGNWYVQASYDPEDGTATLLLAGPDASPGGAA